MTKDNVFDFPVSLEGSTPLQIARSFLEYIKDKPKAKVIIVIKDDEDSTVSMGWSKMDAGEMSLMLRFANFKWERATFEEIK